MHSGKWNVRTDFWPNFDLWTRFFKRVFGNIPYTMQNTPYYVLAPCRKSKKSNEVFWRNFKNPIFGSQLWPFDLVSMETRVFGRNICSYRTPLLVSSSHAENQKNLMKRSGEISKKPDFLAQIWPFDPGFQKQEFLVIYHIHCRTPLISV